MIDNLMSYFKKPLPYVKTVLATFRFLLKKIGLLFTLVTLIGTQVWIMVIGRLPIHIIQLRINLTCSA